MRIHISLEDDLVEELDRRVDRGERSAFVAALIRRALDDERRWDQIEQALGALEDGDRDWDDDPAAWVRRQRGTDERRVG